VRDRHVTEEDYYYYLYNEDTEPLLPGRSQSTAPIPAIALPRESWFMRMLRAIGRFVAAIIKKINQLLALALAVLLLLLFTRFALYFFGLKSSLFSTWVFQISAPLVMPFTNLIPPLPFYGYTIDVSTLIAIIVYALTVTIVRQFLKVLIARPL
jgi:uncharacterized protein YggT (Ycf19 family)